MQNYSPTWKHILLSDVFKFFNREELESLEINSRFILAIVKQNYATKPFRVFGGLNIYIGTNNNLTVILWNKFARLFQDFSNIAQFKAKQHDYANSGKCLDFSIDEVRPFLGQTVRFEVTNIFLSHSRTNPQHIAEIESVAHLWTDQYVCINGDYCQFQTSMPIAPTPIHDCDLIFRSSVIMNSCRQLRIQNINMAFKSYPILYNLEVVEFSLLEDFDISPVNFVGFVEEIGHNKSNTVVLFHTVSESQEKQFVEQIRQTFLTTREPLKFKAILVTHSNVAGFNGENKLKLPVEYSNGHTNGTLQMRSMKGQEREDFCKILRKSRVDTQYLNLLCIEC
ncbi:hypothetical protein Ddc_13725 [Ditylenchus destructor]|nr:hypothetical protein Ddc_13725 [Ditylenchus destructor]